MMDKIENKLLKVWFKSESITIEEYSNEGFQVFISPDVDIDDLCELLEDLKIWDFGLRSKDGSLIFVGNLDEYRERENE